jgi:hypothetical protein
MECDTNVIKKKEGSESKAKQREQGWENVNCVDEWSYEEQHSSYIQGWQ